MIVLEFLKDFLKLEKFIFVFALVCCNFNANEKL